MSDIIHLLPDHIANQIAAGEVIQRPASVVKELVENAVDAGASNIQVNIKDAGKTLIQVIDDGKGMSETDARMAFERHATSKISTAEDLFSLHTMGFRGEALASIAAVAHIELRTRARGTELGTCLSIAGSNLESIEPEACNEGSIFSVKNLFFNVPARRKFLKSNETEFRNIINEFERIALVNPQVGMSLYHNDAEIFNLPESGLRQRIINIYGKSLNQKLLSLDAQSSMVTISGFVGRPDSAKKRGALQFFFVNGRYMKHPYFHKAIMQAYEQLIPAGDMPNYFVYFTLDPSSIDVNIHPTKTEIKFENEQAIWQIISAAIKETLGKFNAVPSIDFDTEDMPDIPAFEQNLSSAPPTVQYNSDYNPFKVSTGGGGGGAYSRSKVDWEDLYGGLTKASKMNNPQPEPEMDWEDSSMGGESAVMEERTETVMSAASSTLYASEPVIEKGNQHLQFKGRFILTSVKSGLMLIDQHRAHIRVLFDRYMVQIQQKQGVSQGVLFPEILQLPASEAAVLQSIMDDLSAVGFDLSDLGGGSYAINGIPSGIEGLNPVELVRNMLHTAMEKGNDVKEEVQNILALTLARAAAIVYGQVLSNEEMVSLVDSLFACPSPNYTPDGKTVLTTIKEEDIERLFK